MKEELTVDHIMMKIGVIKVGGEEKHTSILNESCLMFLHFLSTIYALQSSKAKMV